MIRIWQTCISGGVRSLKNGNALSHLNQATLLKQVHRLAALLQQMLDTRSIQRPHKCSNGMDLSSCTSSQVKPPTASLAIMGLTTLLYTAAMAVWLECLSRQMKPAEEAMPPTSIQALAPGSCGLRIHMTYRLQRTCLRLLR